MNAPQRRLGLVESREIDDYDRGAQPAATDGFGEQCQVGERLECRIRAKRPSHMREACLVAGKQATLRSVTEKNLL